MRSFIIGLMTILSTSAMAAGGTPCNSALYPIEHDRMDCIEQMYTPLVEFNDYVSWQAVLHADLWTAIDTIWYHGTNAASRIRDLTERIELLESAPVPSVVLAFMGPPADTMTINTTDNVLMDVALTSVTDTFELRVMPYMLQGNLCTAGVPNVRNIRLLDYGVGTIATATDPTCSAETEMVVFNVAPGYVIPETSTRMLRLVVDVTPTAPPGHFIQATLLVDGLTLLDAHGARLSPLDIDPSENIVGPTHIFTP